MPAGLERIDISLLLWIHRTWRCPPADAFFLWISDVRHFLLPLGLAWVLLLVFGRAPGRWLAVMLAVCLVATDQLASHVIKPWVGRTRPCFVVAGVEALLPQANSFSFPSSHAANIFGAAWTMILARGSRWSWTLLVALAVGLSRVYLGVHYPSDVVGGAVLGLACALAVRAGATSLQAVRSRSGAVTPRQAPVRRWRR